MRKAITKLGFFIVAVTMAMGGLVVVAGCGTTSSLILQQRTNAIGYQIDYWQKGGNFEISELDLVVRQIEELREEAQEQDLDTLLERLEKFREELNEIRMKRISADFVLTISTNTNFFQFGQNVEVEMVFKNQSGRQLRIAHTKDLMVPFILDSDYYNEMRFPVSLIKVLEIDESIVADIWNLGSSLPRGEHKLIATAKFSIVEIVAGVETTSLNIRVKSNIVTLIVE